MKRGTKIVLILLIILSIGGASSVEALERKSFDLIMQRLGLRMSEEHANLAFEKINSLYKEKEIKEEAALKKLFGKFTHILKTNITDRETNGEVSQLQKLLKKHNFYFGPIDGSFGPGTRQGINLLQQKYDISSGGKGIFDFRSFIDDGSERRATVHIATDEVYFHTLEITPGTTPIIRCDNEERQYITKSNRLIVPLSFPYGRENDSYGCIIETASGSREFLRVYNKETAKETSHATIEVSDTHANPNTANQDRIAQERAMIKKLYDAHASDTAKFTEPFDLPIGSELTSPFGKTRMINGELASFHSGTDWRAVTPADIMAAQSGTVLFAGDLFYCGNTVIINHGLDIFTTYCHLSEIGVATGANISKGDVIGKTGDTGRVSGPHLHVSSKFRGNFMDFMTIYNNSQGI